MIVANGATDVTTYWVLRDSNTQLPKADVTVGDIDVYYVTERAAISSKADLTALGAADSAHTDNYGYNVGQGVYRIDWPDIWSGGVGKKVYLIVVCSGCDTVFREVTLSPSVNLPWRKNTAVSGFTFFMYDSTDHVSAKTGLTVTAQRSLDGAAFASCANSVSEMANGWYKIDLAAGDLNADVVALRFTATGADPTGFTLKTGV